MLLIYYNFGKTHVVLRAPDPSFFWCTDPDSKQSNRIQNPRLSGGGKKRAEVPLGVNMENCLFIFTNEYGGGEERITFRNERSKKYEKKNAAKKA